MSKISRLAICLFILFSMVGHVYGVPARPTPFAFKQSDGSEVIVNLYGDENSNFYLSEDGVLLLPDEKGDLYFAELGADDKVRMSSVLAKNISQRNTSEKAFVSSLDKNKLLMKYKTRLEPSRSRRLTAPIQRSAAYPTTGRQRVLVILAEFADEHFKTENPKDAFNRMLNEPGYSENGGTGSAKDYYMESSSGQYEPIIDVYGPVTLPNKMEYYGAPSGNSSDSRPEEMIIDACKLLDDEIDFSLYNLDDDSYIDNVYVFYAGYGQAEGGNPNTIWPHAWYVESGAKKRIVLDGVRLDRYACSNEINYGTNKMVGIGTFCHEFGHVLGLPDIYSAAYTSEAHPGPWSLMASGSYNNGGKTPPYFSAYERYAMGWIDPIVVNPADTVFSLPDISSNKAYMIKTKKENEYFLLENRQLKNWDTYLPGHGMLVWHIDYNKDVWFMNTVNDNSNHQYIDIEEANGQVSERTRNGNTFPGASNVISITDDTQPGLLAWDGSRRNLGIYNIYETKDSLILFDVINTVGKLSAVVAKQPTEVSPVSFCANWEKLQDATSYVIDVYQKNESGKTVYIEGYHARQVGDVSHVTVEGLAPETEYFYKVRGKGTYIGDYSGEVAVKTLEKDFRFFAPEIAEATEITPRSFVANWKPMKDAKSYQVSVYRIEKGEVYYLLNDFAEGTKMPEGWETNCITTYGAPGYYGKESPALSANKNEAYVQSPIEEGEVTSFSFWYRGSTNLSENSQMNIYGYKNGEWKKLDEIKPIEKGLGGTEYTLDGGVIGDSYFAIRVELIRDAGSVAWDDMVVGHRKAIEIEVPEYISVNVADNLYLQVSNLEPNTLYGYKIRANNGLLDSKYSKMSSVRTLEYGNNIESAVTDSFDLYAADGKLVLRNYNAESHVAEIYTPSGLLLNKTALNTGLTEIPLPTGIYIVRIEGKTYKVVI